MRALAILIIVAVVLMFLGGWLYFRDSGATSEIILDKEKVQQDTEKAVGGLKKLGEKTEKAFSDDDASAETPEETPAKQPGGSP